DTRKDEDEPEEAKAVQCCDSAVHSDQVHRPQPRQNIRAEAKQPGDIAQDKMGLEQQFRGHLVSCRQLVHAASNTALRTPTRASSSKKSIMAALTSSARCCSVQSPQPGSQPADRRISWRSDSASSRIEPGTTKAGVSTLG